MFCSKCGAPLEEGAKFCGKCGGQVVTMQPPVQSDDVTELNLGINSVTPIEPVTMPVQNTSMPEQSMSSNPAGMSGPNMSYQQNTNQPDVDNSVIRKAIKKDARNKPRGPLMGAMALLIVIPIVILLIFGVSIIGAAISESATGTFASLGIFTLLMIAYAILAMFVMFGIIRGCINISKGNPVTIGDVFTGVFKNFGSFGKYLLGSVLYGLSCSLVTMVPFIGPLVAMVGQIYLMPVLFAFTYTLADDNYKQLGFGEAFKKAFELAKSRRVEFYAMIISFIGWCLLSVVTFGLTMIWVMPYMQVSLANMYRHWLGETTYTDAEKGLSNGAVIGVGIATYVATFIIMFFIIFMGVVGYLIANGTLDENGQIKKSYDYSDNYDYSDTSSKTYKETDTKFTLSEDGVKITLGVPSGYRIDSAYSDDSYVKLKNTDTSKYSERIYYQIRYNFEGNLDKEISTLKKTYVTVAGSNQLNENAFDLIIKGKTAKVYQASIARSYGNSDTTYILYPLNAEKHLEVEIGGLLVSQNDISKYLIIK